MCYGGLSELAFLVREVLLWFDNYPVGKCSPTQTTLEARCFSSSFTFGVC